MLVTMLIFEYHVCVLHTQLPKTSHTHIHTHTHAHTQIHTHIHTHAMEGCVYERGSNIILIVQLLFKSQGRSAPYIVPIHRHTILERGEHIYSGWHISLLATLDWKCYVTSYHPVKCLQE